jgi:hypothetical protein
MIDSPIQLLVQTIDHPMSSHSQFCTWQSVILEDKLQITD